MQRKFRNETIFAPSDHACAGTGNSCNPPACCHNSSSWPFRLTQESRNESNFDSPIADTFSSMRDFGHGHILAHNSPSYRMKAEFGLKPKFRNETNFALSFLDPVTYGGQDSQLHSHSASAWPAQLHQECRNETNFALSLSSLNKMDRRQTHPPYYNGTISGPQENR